MLKRRKMLGGGLLAGLTGMLATPEAAEAAAAIAAEDTSEAAAAAIDKVRSFLERQSTPGSAGVMIAAIRQQQRVFIRAHEKYPDFIEVGLGAWEEVYDWHVRYQQPITASRLTDGRYMMAFMFTNLLLRPDQATEYVGFGFDTEQQRRGN